MRRRRANSGAVKADDAQHLGSPVIARFDEQVVDEMACGCAADAGGSHALAPFVEFLDLVPPLKAVVSHHHQTIRHVELVGVATAVAIDFVPVSSLQAIQYLASKQ